jgi:hypothetical protein
MGLGKSLIPRFQDAIRRLHGSESTYVESVPVHEEFEGQTVWQGVAHVFDLQGHPAASRAYVWAYTTLEEPERERWTAVLHQGPVDSPLAAVRAAIVQDHRQQGGKADA